ncbi:MAG: Ldh family oxidoreductase [Chloroflexota bacterium]
MSDTHRFPVDQLQNTVQDIFIAVETPSHIAKIVAKILIGANLAGHDSHGVLRVPAYLNQIEAGKLNPKAEPEIRVKTGTTLLVDGHFGFGHYMAHQGMNWAIEKAKQSNISCVSFTNSTHIGRLGEYAEMAANAGCITLITYGMGGASGSVVPFGGAKGALGTNPLAVGIPTGTDAPFILDFATSVVAEGKLQVARSKNASVPEGYIVDSEGNTSTNPLDFYNGGYLLPIGGHKGYGLSLMTALLGGLGGNFKPEGGFARGEMMQVINVEAFMPLETYQQGAAAFLNQIKQTPPSTGFEQVLVPGDPEHNLRQQRLTQGIDLPDTIKQQLQEVATHLNVSFPTGDQ